MIDERVLKRQCQEVAIKEFHRLVAKHDQDMIPIMKQRGYTYVQSTERTVTLTFGEIRFRRRRWRKGRHWVTPVDDYLGLEPYVRYSKEFLYQVAELATMMPYAKVVHTVWLTYNVHITKSTVVKAVKLARQLLEEREDYRFFEEKEAPQKQAVDIIYIEGDGVMVKARHEETENRHFDLSHFMVHTGSQRAGGKRFVLTGKKEFLTLSNRLTRDQVIDYLYNHFDITDKTLLITNSDGGHGYTPYVFKEMAKALGIKHHEHFWDEYHVNKYLKKTFKPYCRELLDLAFQAIQTHDKGKLRMAFETAESLEESSDRLETLVSVKKQYLANFQYTLSAEMRGLPPAGIGVMESQHRKITYRMKKRGMYWTFWGAETMAQLIVMLYEGNLRELFFGDWREKYQSISQGSDHSRPREKQSAKAYFPEHRRPWSRDYQRSIRY
ncbi:ISLre2 family transposase [Streptococcus suis]|nr:ISLre2 family transposase [Streptococcus suis]